MENQSLKNTTLLVMDVQTGIVDRLPNKEEYLANLKKAVDVAHQSNIQVMYVVVGFRSGFPEVSEQNKSFSAIRNNMSSMVMDPRPALEPLEGDIVVTKRRVSAFSGSDLEVILRAKKMSRLVLTGIATSGVVLSTLREAADKDYQLTVIADLCADFDSEVHSVLMGKVFPRQADVVTGQEWVAYIQGD